MRPEEGVRFLAAVIAVPALLIGWRQFPRDPRSSGQTPSRQGSTSKGDTMDDATIHERIEKLVNEEHELWQREAAGHADDATRQRLAEVKVSLDQTWDLLRQREALRAAHMDPDVAVERDPSVVENYRQ